MVFFGGKLGSECFGFSLFLFLFSVGRESRQHTGFWLAIKGKGPLQVVVSFLSLFGCEYSVLFGYLSGPRTLLYISFVFFRSLIGDFLFFLRFLPIFDRELLFFFFSFLPIFDREVSFFFCFLLIFDRELPSPFFVFETC